MIKLLFISLLVILTGCTTTGSVNLETKTITLKGYGAEGFSYEKDGEKNSITRGKPIPIPDVLPIR